MDTVLGLSMTPTTVGWVLTDGQDVDGAALAGEEFRVGRHCDGVGAVNTSAQAAETVLRLRTAVEAQGQRLRGIGVTWSGDAAAEAALLLESLTDAGLDNVVPIRFQQAAESLAGHVDPIDGSDRAAVCMIEPGRATVVMPEDSGGDVAPVVAQQAVDGDDGLVGWLTTLFTSGDPRPDVLAVAGPENGLDELATRIRGELALPVVAVAEAQLALARGAALALQPGTEFTDAKSDDVLPPPDPGADDVDRVHTRMLSYTGAMAMLVVGVLTFVVSVSIALTRQLVPTDGSRPVQQVASASQSPVAQVVTPAAPAPVPEPPVEATESAAFRSIRETAPVNDGMTAPRRASQPGAGRSLLSRVLNRISGLRGH